jgi:hypothetical protein
MGNGLGTSKEAYLGLVLENSYNYRSVSYIEIALTNQEDRHIWRPDASRCYSSKSVHKAYFLSAVTFEPWHRLWKTWALAKCKMFLWLTI